MVGNFVSTLNTLTLIAFIEAFIGAYIKHMSAYVNATFTTDNYSLILCNNVVFCDCIKGSLKW